MIELEQQIHDALSTPARKRRFTFLVEARAVFARLAAELTCWTGSVEHVTLDRQVLLHEEAIANLVPDPALAAELSAQWIVQDASMVHVRGYPPPGLDCPVCKDGAFGVSDVLARDMLDRLPDEIS